MLNVHNFRYNFMTKLTVKARERHGSNSLDLTLPSSIIKEFSLNKGDIYKVETIEDKGEFKVVYTLIFKNDD